MNFGKTFDGFRMLVQESVGILSRLFSSLFEYDASNKGQVCSSV